MFNLFGFNIAFNTMWVMIVQLKLIGIGKQLLTFPTKGLGIKPKTTDMGGECVTHCKKSFTRALIRKIWYSDTKNKEQYFLGED